MCVPIRAGPRTCIRVSTALGSAVSSIASMAFAVLCQYLRPFAMHLRDRGLKLAEEHWEAYNGGAKRARKRPTAGELVHGVRFNRSPEKRSMRAKGMMELMERSLRPVCWSAEVPSPPKIFRLVKMSRPKWSTKLISRQPDFD